jgi:hypothetical protein
MIPRTISTSATDPAGGGGGLASGDPKKRLRKLMKSPTTSDGSP